MKRKKRLHESCALIIVAIVACCRFTGCGETVKPEYPVKGTVTLDGNPLAEGDIYFRDESTATASVLNVKDGRFEGMSEAGTFKVEINAYREEAAQADATGYTPPGGSTKVNIVSREFNTNSKITAEVKAEGSNEFTFEAKSK